MSVTNRTTAHQTLFDDAKREVRGIPPGRPPHPQASMSRHWHWQPSIAAAAAAVTGRKDGCLPD